MCITRAELEKKIEELRSLKALKEETENELKALEYEVISYMKENELTENLQCTCKTCNEFKDNILPDQFLDRVTEIFLYQMKKKCNNDWIWNVTERLIKKRLKTME